MRTTRTALLALTLVPLAACQVYEPTTTPDYTIAVMQTKQGMVAVPPTCPSWSADITNPYDNQPVPQFGCATARNLALMTERPQDLVTARDLGPTPGVTMTGAMFRYNNSQTRGLVAPVSSPDSAVDTTTASTASSSISGDLTSGLSGNSTASSGGGSSSSSSSGSAVSAAATNP